MESHRMIVHIRRLPLAIVVAATLNDQSMALDLSPGQSFTVIPGATVQNFNLTGATLKVIPGGETFGISAGASSTVNLDGAVVNASSGGLKTGLTLIDSNALVTNSTINSPRGSGLGANTAIIESNTGSRAMVTNSTISGFGRGVTVSGGSSVTLINSNVAGSGTGAGGIAGDGVGLSLVGGSVTLQGSNASGSNRGAVLVSNTAITNTPILTLDSSILSGTAGSAILVGTANAVPVNATVMVQNGSTLNGGNGLILEVGQTTTTSTPSTVNFTADNSALRGDVQVVPGSIANLTLRNNASLTGTISNAQDMTIDSTSQWAMVNDSNVASLNLQGGQVSLRGANAGFRTLTLGSLSGSGTFALGTDLAAHQSDLVNVTGNATGTHQLLIANTGAEPPEEDHAQQVVHAGSGDAAFSVVGGAVDAGTFVYNLEQRGTDWFLVQARDDNGEPVITPGTETVRDVFSAAPSVWYGELATLRVRMGELRNGRGQGGVWVRSYGNKFNVAAAGGAPYSQIQSGISLGADTPLPSSDGLWLVGVLGGYSFSNLDIQRGSSGEVHSAYLGLYSTWLSTSGYYLDAVVKLNRFHNAADALMDDGVRTKGDYYNMGMGASLEGGKHIELRESWFVEPYVQLSTLFVQGRDYQLDNGLDANGDAAKSLLGKIGTHVGRTYRLDRGGFVQPYVKIAVAQEFAKSNTVSVNDINFNNDLSGTRGELGMGIAAQLTDQWQVHADLDYSNGDHIEQPWGLSAGLRYLW